MTLPPITLALQPVGWTLISARGEEALSFLNGQLSADLVSLTEGESAAALLLSPSGEVVTSLVCRAVSGGVDLVVRDESALPAVTALRRFLMRTKCSIDIAGATAGPYTTVGEQVRRGEPGPAEFARNVSAHTFGRDFVARHVSFVKGCFTGQELVGRLDARGGNVPFRLARVSGTDVARMHDVVMSAGPSGERALQGLTTIVADARFSALALVHRTLLSGSVARDVGDVHVALLHEGVDAAS